MPLKTFKGDNLTAPVTPETVAAAIKKISQFDDKISYTKEEFIKQFNEVTKPAELTMKKIAVDALMAETSEEKLSGSAKLTRYDLAERIHTSTTNVELETVEITMLEELVGKAWNTIVYGAFKRAMDAQSTKNTSAPNLV